MMQDAACADKETLLWNAARATFFGLNLREQDMIAGVRLAAECAHKDAVWLTSVFADSLPGMKQEAKNRFLEQDSARALCFAGLIGDEVDDALVCRSAEMGYALAQGVLAECDTGEKKFFWASKAAVQHDANGTRELADCFLAGDGCPKDKTKAVALFREAAILQDVCAQFKFGLCLSAAESERYLWWGKAAASGHCDARDQLIAALFSLSEMSEAEERAVRFALGSVFVDHIDSFTESVFGDVADAEVVEAACKAVALVQECCAKSKSSIWCWIWAAKQIGVAKDIRIVIAKLVWNVRAAWFKCN